jgi:hypothetical protein
MSDKYIFIISVVLITTIILAAIACISKTEGYAKKNKYSKKGQKCGPKNGNKLCDQKLCCSPNGICGSKYKHCVENTENIRFSDRGVPNGSKWIIINKGQVKVPNEEVPWVLRSSRQKIMIKSVEATS